MPISAHFTGPAEAGKSNDEVCARADPKLEDLTLEQGRVGFEDLVWVEGNMRVGAGH